MLTGTTPNRLYLWTGTIREKQEATSHANVLNANVDYGVEAKWTTFPERLEEAGISWKIYQNELSLDSGLQGEEDAWLSNFTDNPIEWFTQYNVRFAASQRKHAQKMLQALSSEIEGLQKRVSASPAGGEEAKTLQKQIEEKTALQQRLKAEDERWSVENFAKLSEREKNLHRKAFCTNTGDPFYRELTTLTYRDGDTERQVQVPKGDVLHQFRQDVQNGQLPTVSWLVGPENFSDHPGAAWYGAWYVSEALDILTKNPEVWKKTIFLLTYDENDGYFDHVPPFVAPNPHNPETGQTSKGIDTSVEFVTHSQDSQHKPAREARESAIGLGYRVPLVIASPWTRGGCVCSEVFDHTSVLQFLETFLTHKTGKKVEETNISAWRRTVCGDLTSAFQTLPATKPTVPAFPPRNLFIESIHQAKFKGLPSGYKGLTSEEITQIKTAPSSSSLLPQQEPGIRRSCALPYELYADDALNQDKSRFRIHLEAGKDVFGERAAGSPFQVYAYHGPDKLQARSYAATAGDYLADEWALADFDDGHYHLRIDGPNGFHREFQGTSVSPDVGVKVTYAGSRKMLNGEVAIMLVNEENRPLTLEIRDNAYNTGKRKQTLAPHGKATLLADTRRSHGWYDFSVRIAGTENWERRYAGRVEKGKWSYSDPAMGKVKA